MTPDFNTQAERLNAQFTRGILTEAEYFRHVDMLLFQAREERANQYEPVCQSCNVAEVRVKQGDTTFMELNHAEGCQFVALWDAFDAYQEPLAGF